MATGSFVMGQRFALGDISCRLMRDLGATKWVVEELVTGRLREETTMTLLKHWESGDLRFYEEVPSKEKESKLDTTALNHAYQDAFRQSYPPELWRRAQEKLSFLEYLKNFPLSQSVIEPLIKEKWQKQSQSIEGSVFNAPPHFTTVATWRREYRRSGSDIRALIDRHHEKGNKDERYIGVVERITDDCIDTLYLTLERQSKKHVLEAVKGLVAKQNLARLPSEQLPIPRYNYIKSKIAERPAYDVAVARYGKRLADIRFRAAGRGVVAMAPLARASFDHCRLDVMVIDEKTGLPLGRPWLSLVIDDYSRYVLGYCIGFEEPSGVSVARALRHAFSPKASWLENFPDVVSEWDAWGVSSFLAVDQGMELHCKSVEEGAGRFGTILFYCPRKKPWYKGKIERYFRTMNTGLIDTIPGKTFSNVLEKEDYDPSDHAVIRLSTLREIVAIWIVDVYHQQLHRGLGKSPAQAWKEGIANVDRWLPTSSLSVESAFARVENRRLTHKGIEYDSLLYNSQDLRVVREQFGSEINVEIRIMDDDVGSIVVVVPGGEQLIRVPALEVEYALGLTRWQHKICKRYQRRMADDQSALISLFDAKQKIRDLIAADMRLIRRKSRKKQARFQESSTSSMPDSPPQESKAALPMPDITAETMTRQVPYTSPHSTPLIVDDIPVLGSRRVRS
ncbi:MAG: hypothetical protein ACREPB_16420 [Arenimonas sp.]